MPDAIVEDAAPEDEVPPEYRVQVEVPEALIAVCGRERKGLVRFLLREHFMDGVIVAYGSTRLVVDAFTDHPLRVVFWALMLCLAARSIYMWGWRRPYRVELTRTTLRWVAPFRRVEVPLLSVRRVFPHTWGGGYLQKVLVDGARPGRTRKLSLKQLDETDPFLAVLTTAAPGVQGHVSELSAPRWR
ncbi:MAG TPA: hypothetical protein VL551_14220 [Actinospica sp.]|jgi:hypothetical protein|nr:hypothetical protein [Actinospica sp.]